MVCLRKIFYGSNERLIGLNYNFKKDGISCKEIDLNNMDQDIIDCIKNEFGL